MKSLITAYCQRVGILSRLMPQGAQYSLRHWSGIILSLVASDTSRYLHDSLLSMSIDLDKYAVDIPQN